MEMKWHPIENGDLKRAMLDDFEEAYCNEARANYEMLIKSMMEE